LPPARPNTARPNTARHKAPPLPPQPHPHTPKAAPPQTARPGFHIYLFRNEVRSLRPRREPPPPPIGDLTRSSGTQCRLPMRHQKGLRLRVWQTHRHGVAWTKRKRSFLLGLKGHSLSTTAAYCANGQRWSLKAPYLPCNANIVWCSWIKMDWTML
jgi:hypothetical protein